MGKRTKKLALAKDTVAKLELDAHDLDQAAGGVLASASCNSCPCSSNLQTPKPLQHEP